MDTVKHLFSQSFWNHLKKAKLLNMWVYMYNLRVAWSQVTWTHFISCLILCQLIQIVSYRDLAKSSICGYNPYGLVMVVWVEHVHVYWKCPDLTHYILTLLVWKFPTIDKEGQLMNISVWEWGWSCGVWFCTRKCNSFAVCYSLCYSVLLCVTCVYVCRIGFRTWRLMWWQFWNISAR